MTPPDNAAPTCEPALPASSPTSLEEQLRALLIEWFVTYNPLPLASAALVLGGLWIASDALTQKGLVGALGVSAVAELYALALIASAWVLRRRGHGRSAVMLGLLAALYQCDLTLHLELCAYLGTIGVVALLAWVALFAIKLDLLARGLGLALSRSARWVPTVGAALVALMPLAARWTTYDERSTFAALAVFVIGAAALSTDRAVRSEAGFDVRGRRAMRGVQLLFVSAVLAHLAYMRGQMHVSAVPVIAALVLVGTRLLRGEHSVWLVSVAAVLGVVWVEAAFAPLTLGLAAASLALHALRVRAAPPLASPAPSGASYRGAPLIDELTGDDVTTLAAAPIVFTRASAQAQQRLVLGVIALGYLGVATWGADTLFSVHHAAADVGLVALCLGLFAHRRSITRLAPIGVGVVHVAIVEELLVAPRDALELGVWAIATGFAVLGLSVATSVRLGERAASSDT